MLDIIVAAIVFWGLVRGWLRGFLYQLGTLLVWVVAVGAGRALAPLARRALPTFEGVPPLLVDAAVFFGLVSVIVALGTAAVRAMSRDFREAAPTLGSGDRAVGTAVGGVKGGLIAYVLVLGLIMLNQSTGAVPIPYHSTLSGRWVARHNVLDNEEFPRARALFRLGWVMQQRRGAALVEDPHVHAILTHPKARAMLTPSTARALAEGDWVRLVADEGLWDLLDEPDIQEHLNALEATPAGEGDSPTRVAGPRPWPLPTIPVAPAPAPSAVAPTPPPPPRPAPRRAPSRAPTEAAPEPVPPP